MISWAPVAFILSSFSRVACGRRSGGPERRNPRWPRASRGFGTFVQLPVRARWPRPRSLRSRLRRARPASNRRCGRRGSQGEGRNQKCRAHARGTARFLQDAARRAARPCRAHAEPPALVPHDRRTSSRRGAGRAARRLRPPLPLAEAAAVHAYVESRESFGGCSSSPECPCDLPYGRSPTVGDRGAPTPTPNSLLTIPALLKHCGARRRRWGVVLRW